CATTVVANLAYYFDYW
nr:immunoglobulin heavy chain junction region [Mus musculus]NSM03869.1 immunoglobulin heavy chain junction region [Mus musculus]NSM03896.1 immunoglobulin heavy chain junction region [Mus musculus]NSM04191.1 immunoglobulin heavy chain junction region [Mus musculus]NSM04559.1 immunoglobulin heavy chain junction region [Mus musculus]